MIFMTATAMVMATSAGISQATAPGDQSQQPAPVESRPPHPHPGGLPPPPPPPPWDNAEFGATMDRFLVDLQQFGDRYSIVWLEVIRLIEALPQSPGERELRPVRDAIVRLNDHLGELTQLVLRLDTISLMFAGNLSERDAFRLAQHRRSLFNSEPRTRAAAEALIARLPHSSTPR